MSTLRLPAELAHRAADGIDSRARRWLLGLLAGAVLVALVTAVIAVLESHVPVLSLGALYIFAVLPIAVFWGLALAVTVSVASMLAFNFYFLPPTHTLTLQDSRNWFALGVFVVTSVVVSGLAARSRRRAVESELLAEIASSLLGHGDVVAEFDRISPAAADALRVERVEIALTPGAPGYPLLADDRQVGTIRLVNPRRGGAAGRRRLLRALASLLGVAIDRQRLTAEVLEAETLRRSDTAKTAVLRAVTHDLRSPLMAMLTSASALAQEDLALDPDDRRELVLTMLTETRRLSRLIDNLLDLSRLEAGAATPETDVWPVDELITQALDETEDPDGRIAVELPERPLGVRADPRQIERVLVNLFENALKYSPREEPVHVQAGGTPRHVLVRVVDHGPGVAGADREHIFEPFRRGANGHGAGLGLAIAQGFAEANGARVWAESRPGQGAAFVLELEGAPLADDE
jgi:two-component system, OmpR family, sensor histidine kinase KdpD